MDHIAQHIDFDGLCAATPVAQALRRKVCVCVCVCVRVCLRLFVYVNTYIPCVCTHTHTHMKKADSSGHHVILTFPAENSQKYRSSGFCANVLGTFTENFCLRCRALWVNKIMGGLCTCEKGVCFSLVSHWYLTLKVRPHTQALRNMKRFNSISQM